MISQCLLKEYTFPLAQFHEYANTVGCMNAIRTHHITVDGNVDDWKAIDGYHLPYSDGQIKVFQSDGKPHIVTADVKAAYDDTALYLLFDVYDPIFVPITKNDPRGNCWDGDGIQLSFIPITDPDLLPDTEVAGYDFGLGTGGVSEKTTNRVDLCIVCDPNSVFADVTSAQLDESSLARCDVKACRHGDHTVYEMALPWDVILLENKLDDQLLFNFCINNNDGNGRSYCIEMTDGIAKGKDDSAFICLKLDDAAHESFGFITMDRHTGLYGGYRLYLLNRSSTEQHFSVYARPDGSVREITVDGHTAACLYYDFSGVGTFQMICDVRCEHAEYTVKSRYFTSEAAFCSVEDAKVILEDIENMHHTLETLLDTCKAAGIHTPYEIAKKTVISRFCRNIQEDIAAGHLETIRYTGKCLKQLFIKTEAALQAYMHGEKKPFSVPRYLSSKDSLRMEDGYFSALTEHCGTVARRPFFMTGFGHFSTAINDIPIFADMGFSVIQTGVYVSDLIGKPREGTPIPGNTLFSLLDRGIIWTQNILEKAHAHNIAVDLLFSPHVFPAFIIEQYPELLTGSPEFIRYNIMDARIQSVLVAALEALIPKIRSYPALQSICLSNEPIFRTALSAAFYHPYYTAFLEKRFDGKIEKLNIAYSSRYSSFHEVPFPEIDKHGYLLFPYTPPAYDYCDFNTEILSAWHRLMCETVRKLAPELPLHTKMHLIVRSSDRNPSMRTLLDAGVQYRYYADMFDIHGNDGGCYLTNPWHLRHLDYSMQLDYQRSFGNKPAANTEDHILQDRITPYESIYSDYAAWQIWQGSIHGKCLSAIWTWERSYERNDPLYASILCRPDAVAYISETALDLNRLSNEVIALQQAKPTVAILYSDASRLYDDTYMDECYAIYESVRFSGVNVKFVLETDETLSEKLDGIHLLLIPRTPFIKETFLPQLSDYVFCGGRIVMIGKDSFRYNEYANPALMASNACVSVLYNHADVISVPDITEYNFNTQYFAIVHRTVREVLFTQKLAYVNLLDLHTGEAADDIEINTALYRDTLLINLNNLSEDRHVYICIGHHILPSCRELRSGATYADKITLQKYRPILLAFPLSDFPERILNEIGIDKNHE